MSIPEHIIGHALAARGAVYDNKIANVGYAPGNGGRYSMTIVDVAGHATISDRTNDPDPLPHGFLVVATVPYRFSGVIHNPYTRRSNIPTRIAEFHRDMGRTSTYDVMQPGDVYALWVFLNLVAGADLDLMEEAIDADGSSARACVDGWKA